MKINYLILIFALIIVLVLFFTNYGIENYNQGALLQLVAKGPQDTYLTGDAWKYAYYPYYSRGWYSPWSFWNYPTRMPRKYRYAYRPWYLRWF